MRKHAKKTALEVSQESGRSFPLLPSVAGRTDWSDVPDSVIVDLVRSYTSSGDAILFGTSTDQEVLAIRVYRLGHGYSVYARGIERLGEALDRLQRYRPPRHYWVKKPSEVHPAGQGLSKQAKGTVIDWDSFPTVKRQETPISAEKLQSLSDRLTNRRKNKVDSQ